MGFGKKEDEEPKRKRHSDPKKFEPTTKEQWKKISKRARKRDEERENGKAEKREKEKTRKRFRKDTDGLRAQLAGTGFMDVRIFKNEFFEAIVKFIKDNGGTPPAYHAFEEIPSVADARFRFDLHLALARMSWMQHHKLIEAAVGQPIATRDWTEAWHGVCRLVAYSFDIRIDKFGNERIRDREALDDWPIPERKRAVKLSDEEKVHKRDVPHRLERAKKMRKKKGKEDIMTLDMFEEDEKRRLSAARDKDDDEDEDEEEEQEDDEEEDEDEDDESDEDDDEEDDRKSKKSKKSKKSRDDEDEEEDEDEDEDDEPKRKKEKRKVSSKKSGKSEKKSKKSKSEKVEKKEKTSSSGGDTFKVVKKFKGGIKEEVQGLVSAKGSTFEQIVKAAKAAKLDKSAVKIKNYLNWMAANGYLKRV